MSLTVIPDNQAIFIEHPSTVTRYITYTFPDTPGLSASDYTLVGTPVTTTNVSTVITLDSYSDIEKWIKWKVDVNISTENALQGYIQYTVYYLGTSLGISTLINVLIRWLVLDPDSSTISIASYDPETRTYLCDIKNGYDLSYYGPIRCEIENKKLYISAGQDLDVGSIEITVQSSAS